MLVSDTNPGLPLGSINFYISAYLCNHTVYYLDGQAKFLEALHL